MDGYRFNVLILPPYVSGCMGLVCLTPTACHTVRLDLRSCSVPVCCFGRLRNASTQMKWADKIVRASVRSRAADRSVSEYGVLLGWYALHVAKLQAVTDEAVKSKEEAVCAKEAKSHFLNFSTRCARE